jgi:hypothetical protein
MDWLGTKPGTLGLAPVPYGLAASGDLVLTLFAVSGNSPLALCPNKGTCAAFLRLREGVNFVTVCVCCSAICCAGNQPHSNILFAQIPCGGGDNPRIPSIGGGGGGAGNTSVGALWVLNPHAVPSSYSCSHACSTTTRNTQPPAHWSSGESSSQGVVNAERSE